MIQKKIIMYTTSACVYCEQAKRFFREKNIQWEEMNLEEHPEKVQEMIDKSGQMGVPVFDIEGEIIVGYDKRAIKMALGIID
ncbi:glutaredoxin family protein [Candidatus Woesearchaeota archaeon]|nr:glutaredoxin family protein [Candidatus Woesearchaeota archaeon]